MMFRYPFCFLLLFFFSYSFCSSVSMSVSHVNRYSGNLSISSGVPGYHTCCFNVSGSSLSLSTNVQGSSGCGSSPTVRDIPDGSSVVVNSVSGFLSCSLIGSGGSCTVGLSTSQNNTVSSGSWSCSGASSVYGSFSCTHSCLASYTVTASENLPLAKCSEPFSFPVPACHGGTGLFLAVSELVLQDFMSNFPGGSYLNHGLISSGIDTIARSGGSKCVIDPFTSGSGNIHRYVVCPLGYDPEYDINDCEHPYNLDHNPACGGAFCDRNPNDPDCAPTDPPSSSSNGGSSSSAEAFSVCEQFPWLVSCQVSDDSGSGGDGGEGNTGGEGSGSGGSAGSGGNTGGPGGGSTGGSTGGGSGTGGGSLCDRYPNAPGCNGSGDGTGGGAGGNCKDLSNCDWAKVDVQLAQLGVDLDIRAAILSMSRSGDSLAIVQNFILASLSYSLDSLRGYLMGRDGGGGDCEGYDFQCLGDSLGRIGTGLDSLGSRFGRGLDSLGGSLGRIGTGLDSLSARLGAIQGGLFGDCDGYEFDCGPGSGGSGSEGRVCNPSLEDCSISIVGGGDTSWGVTQTFFQTGLKNLKIDSLSFHEARPAVLANASVSSDKAVVFDAVGVALAPFYTYLGQQGGGTVLDFSFNTPLGSCPSSVCRVDFKNFHGYDASAIFNDVLVFSLGLGLLFRLVRVSVTLGQSG